MKNFLFLVVVFCFSSNAEKCDFFAEVIPAEKYRETKRIYKDTCEWYYNNFGQYPQIPLDKVYYIESWDGVKWMEDKESLKRIYRDLEETNGLFCCDSLKNINEIYINTSTYKESFIYNESILFHEVVPLYCEISKL